VNALLFVERLGKKHSVVNYVFKHPYSMLYNYHKKVMHEMEVRGYHATPEWHDIHYRGKLVGFDTSNFTSELSSDDYPERDNECIIISFSNDRQVIPPSIC
jgi:uncharacterized protein (TIGR02328 family)